MSFFANDVKEAETDEAASATLMTTLRYLGAYNIVKEWEAREKVKEERINFFAEAIRKVEGSDPERAHIDATELLLEALEALGGKAIVKAFNETEQWIGFNY